MDEILPCYYFHFKGKKYYINTVGAKDPKEILWSFTHEVEVRDQLWNVQPGDYVLDIGGFCGSYTLTALAAGAELIVVLEPAKEEYFNLCSNLIVNGWINKALPMNVLAGETQGTVAYYPESHSCGRLEGEPEKRLMFPIDQILQLNVFPKLDWIKIDVDGTEEGVLKGAVKTLQKYHPKILLEYHRGFVEGIEAKVATILQPLGYLEKQRIVDENELNDCWGLWSWEGGSNES